MESQGVWQRGTEGNMFSLSGIGLGKDLGVCQGEQSNSQSVSAYILHEGMVSEY